MTEHIFHAYSVGDTEAFGEKISSLLLSNGVRRAFVALRGEMGVGKTAFTRGFCRTLGISTVKSPTYTVVNEYGGGTLPVYHFDLYRLMSEDDLYSIGYEEYLARDGYLLIEWSENAEELLPSDRLTVTLSRTGGEEERLLTLSYPEEDFPFLEPLSKE